MRLSRLKVGGTAAAIAASLGACVSVLPEQPRPEAVFRLAPVETTISTPAILVVREPEAPRLFAGRQLAAEGPNEGLRVVRGVAWADRLTRLLQVTLADSFDETGAGYAVDDSAGISGDYELYWRVVDFSLKGNQGACRLRLTLMDGATREPVAQAYADGEAMATANDAQARARAMAQAGSNCVAKAARLVSSKMTEPAEAPTG